MKNSDPYQPMFFELERIHQESEDVFSLELCPPENQGFDFQAGQFNMLYGFGIGESAISLSCDPNENQKIIHTIRAVGQVTNFLTQVSPKQKIAIRGPFGTPWPLEKCQGKDILLIAGGIGLAPLRSVLYALLNQVANYARITLLYGARSEKDLIFKNDWSHWQKHIQMRITLDHAERSWAGNIGAVTTLIENAIVTPEDTVVMMCGPEVMMHFCLIELQDHGIGLDNIYLSLERNMTCGFGQCGHCQWGPFFICKDGPVMPFSKIQSYFYKTGL